MGIDRTLPFNWRQDARVRKVWRDQMVEGQYCRWHNWDLFVGRGGTRGQGWWRWFVKERDGKKDQAGGLWAASEEEAKQEAQEYVKLYARTGSEAPLPECSPSEYAAILESGYKTLFVVHVERQFQHFWNKTFVIRLRSLIIRPIYNRVVFLNSHIDEDGRMEALSDLRGEDWEWAWGYEPEVFHDPEERKWCVPAHEGLYTWIPPQLRGVKPAQLGAVSVVGGARDECLACWCAALDYCKISYRLLDGLIYSG